MTVRLATANDKGGPGKTTIAVNLAAGIARSGGRVLVIDMDPQANATRRLAAVMDASTPTISDALADRTSGCAEGAITGCGWNIEYACRIDVIPSSLALSNHDTQSAPGWWRSLATVLDGVDDDVDMTVLDCRPGFGILQQMVFAATEGVLGVINPAYDALAGATLVRDFILQYRNDLGNPGLKVAGYVGCEVDRRLTSHRFMLGKAAEILGEPPLEPLIPQQAQIAEANNDAQPLEAYGRKGSEMARLFDQLAARVMEVAV